MEAKKQGSGEEDLSMEEILQSIRRIIADDEEPAKEGTAPADAAASDILELTDMLPDEPAPVANDGDVLSNIDAALAPEASPAPAAVAETPAAAAPKEEPAPAPKSAQDDIDALLSSSAEAAALSSLSKLNIPEPARPTYNTSPSASFRSGGTVEDMVEDLLRPMLKEWLDNNLPAIIERIVEREVTRLTRR